MASGNIGGRGILTKDDLAQHMAIVQGVNDVIWAPRYDSVLYVTAGQTQLTFFTSPIGQGTTTSPGASGNKTIADTNMTAAGQLTKGQAFYMTGVELIPFPSIEPAAGNISRAAPGAFLNDIFDLGKSGWLNFRVQDRDYVTDAPLNLFPPATRLAVNSALALDGALTPTPTQSVIQIDYAQWSGEVYSITPIYLDSNQGFSLQLNWPAAVSLSAQVRIFARLRGYLVRNAQ